MPNPQQLKERIYALNPELKYINPRKLHMQMFLDEADSSKDHMVDALMYSLQSLGRKKLPWYKIMYFKVKRFVRRLLTNTQ